MIKRYKIVKCLLLDRLNERYISQAEFAISLGVSRQQVNDWVHARRIMTAETMKTIIELLGLSGMDDLYEFKEI